MTKQQKQSELKELINCSGINEAIKNLGAKLKTYQHLEITKKDRYLINIEIIEINREMEKLKNQIENLIQLSLIWEKS